MYFLKYIGALLLFGTNGIWAGQIHLSSYEIVFFRTLLGSMTMLGVFLLCRKKFTFTAHRRETLSILLSGIMMGMIWIFMYEAYVRIGVGLASLCYACGPVIVMALSPLLFGEALENRKKLGFLAVVCGICMVNGPVSTEGMSGGGLLCGAMSAVTYAGMIIFNKQAKTLPKMENALLQLLASCVTASLYLGWKGGLSVFPDDASLLPLFILGVANTGIGCWLYFSSIPELSVQTVAVCDYIEPLTAVILACLLLGETMSVLQLAGACLMMGGAVFCEMKGRAERKETVPARS